MAKTIKVFLYLEPRIFLGGWTPLLEGVLKEEFMSPFQVQKQGFISSRRSWSRMNTVFLLKTSRILEIRLKGFQVQICQSYQEMLVMNPWEELRSALTLKRLWLTERNSICHALYLKKEQFKRTCMTCSRDNYIWVQFQLMTFWRFYWRQNPQLDQRI